MSIRGTGSSLVIGQYQDQIGKLNVVMRTGIQSGITIAEDLLEGGQKYVEHIGRVEGAVIDFARLSGEMEHLSKALAALQNISTSVSGEEPPDLTKVFQSEFTQIRKSEFNPETHPAVVEFRKRMEEACCDSDSEEEVINNGDDEDIVLGQVKKSLYCPLTKKFLDDPVTSIHCQHSYSRIAIMEHIKKRSKCPVCNVSLKECDLEKDSKLERQVRKEKKQQARKNNETKQAVVKL